MPSLTGFLLARIAEDEAAARDAARAAMRGEVSRSTFPESIQHYISIRTPARVLAECEAKRRVVGLHEEYTDACNSAAISWRDHNPWPCETLLALASVYADHESFQEEWRP